MRASTSSTPTATLSDAALTGTGAEFGYAVSLSGDGTTALVGAPKAGHDQADVFHVSGEGGWATSSSPTATLTATGRSALGTAVALSSDGTSALVGDPFAGSSGRTDVFAVATEASWTTAASPTAALSDASLPNSAQFGSALALSANGSTALVGAYFSWIDFGAVDIYHVLLTPSTPTISNTPGANTFGGGFTASVSTDSDGTASVSSSTLGVCTVSGSPALTVSYDAPGTCTLTPHVAASSTYAAADGSAVDITVGRVVPSVRISNLPSNGRVGSGFNATVSTNGDGTTSVTSNSLSVCTTSGLVVSYVGVGTCALTAHVTQGADYAAADGDAQTFTVASAHGYWLVGSDGGIFTFGSALFHGSTGNLVLQRPVVGIVPTVDGGGYWLDASDGGVFSFGDTQFYGSIPGLGLHPAGSGLPHSLNAPIVGMVPSHDQGGYFMVASDGGVFAFGDARFAGSCPGIGGCSGAAVAVMPDASGNGYWLITGAGSVYTFGDAPYLGAPGPQPSPITSAVATPDGRGYYILDANGQVFTYGDAAPDGSVASGSTGGFDPASAIFTTSDNGGYWVADALGHVFTFGDAPYDGGMSGTQLNGPIVAATGF